MTVNDVSVRAVLAVGAGGVFGYAVLSQTPIPDWFVALGTSAISFYFGGRATEASVEAEKREVREQRELLSEARARMGARLPDDVE